MPVLILGGIVMLFCVVYPPAFIAGAILLIAGAVLATL